MNYNLMREHIGHKIVCVCYGKTGEDPDNIAIECETCGEVLIDACAGDYWAKYLAEEQTITNGAFTFTAVGALRTPSTEQIQKLKDAPCYTLQDKPRKFSAGKITSLSQPMVILKTEKEKIAQHLQLILSAANNLKTEGEHRGRY